jgi:hypothetical protein
MPTFGVSLTSSPMERRVAVHVERCAYVVRTLFCWIDALNVEMVTFGASFTSTGSRPMKKGWQDVNLYFKDHTWT